MTPPDSPGPSAAVQRTLLSSPPPDRRASWAARAGTTLRRRFGADHVAFVLPGGADVGGHPALEVLSPSPALPVLPALCAAVGRSYPRRGSATARARPAPLTVDPLGWTGDHLGLTVPLSGHARAGFGLFYAAPLDAARREAVRAELLALAPVVERVVDGRLQRCEEAQGRVDALVSAVDGLAVPLALAGAGGEIHHWNRALVRLLSAEPSESLTVQLRVWARHLALARPGGAAPSSKLTTGRGAYRIAGTRLSAALVPSGGAIVGVSRTGLGLPTADAVRDQFGVTAREAEVALLLAQGRTDREVADVLVVAHATARRHAERVLRKLGVTRRSAVAARLVDDACLAGAA